MNLGKQQDEIVERVATYWGWPPEKLLHIMEERIAKKDYYTLWALGAFPIIKTLLEKAIEKGDSKCR